MGRYEYSKSERELMERSRIPFAVYQFIDRRVVTLILSQGFLDLFGFDDPGEAYRVMDSNMYCDTHPDDTARIEEAAYEFATEGGKYEVVYRTKKKGMKDYEMIHAMGEHFHTETGERLAVIWYTDEGSYADGAHLYKSGLNEKLSEAIHEESLLRANYYDYLTGLPSMTYFFELSEEAKAGMRKEGRLPVMLFADLSGMKFYNQKHGFVKGDRLLLSLAELLSEHFGNENCCRFGSDHFAVFTEDKELEIKLDSLLREWGPGSEDGRLPLRLGVYRIGPEDVDISTACDRAKLACDVNKNAFESCIAWFDGDMLDEVENRQYIIENLDKAIESGWIHVYYQPIVRAVNGRICDEEALARWIDPVKGMLPPAQFVPVLEDAGLAYKLDLYMLERVIENLRLSEQRGIRLVPQSINLSRADFDACDIVEEIRKRVDDSGYSRSLFSIEITESTVAKDLDFMREQVERFHELGFPVWMDDFGSGYSSLDVLQSMPFDLIKFDMHFMSQFDEGENGRIILTELMKMVSGLGLDTLCEGVEREDQVEFLRTIGCSRIQGYFYGKPIPLEELFARHERGEFIEYENPDESGYFDKIGRINLHDLAVISNREESRFRHYFNTLPMAVVELKSGHGRFVRKNRSFSDFMEMSFGLMLDGDFTDFEDLPQGPGKAFMKMIERICGSENRTIIDEILPDDTSAHIFLRRIADNPVTGTAAYVVAILAISDDNQGISYANIARTLASDYFNLFSVNMKTEEFVEYSSDIGQEDVAVERQGTDFFNAARTDAIRMIYKDDAKRFTETFTKDKVMKAIDKQGSFALDYRLDNNNSPIYVSMKAVRMRGDSDYVIFGVSNVDAQMNQRRLLERLRQEQSTYNRVSALLGDFIVLYNVDPETEHYMETNVTSDYSRLGLSKDGENFFRQAIINGRKTIWDADFEEYERTFTKENVLRVIRDEGVFTMKYHLMINGEPKLVKLRAALVEEMEGERLIIGVNFIKD